MKTGLLQLELCRACRFFRHHGGHGVHSPFAYRLITEVINERRGYYGYDDIALVRKQLYQDSLPEIRPGHPSDRWPLGMIARRGAISPKQGKLLFRLANFMGARRIVQLGSGIGLASLYLTYPSREARCVVIERDKSWARIAQNVYERWGRDAICLVPSLDNLPDEWGRIDLLVLTSTVSVEEARKAIERVTPRLQGKGMIVVEGLRTDKPRLAFWRWLTEREEMTVTVDLCATGIAILDSKLHKKNYKIYF